ncbi:MAG: hypothetical protein K2K98_10555, partial [Muribaculaceae bacterium]|nr:hypothetical protein [Muribaculaceae bacterium]
GRFCLAPSPKPPAVKTCPDLVGHRLTLMAENPEFPENRGYVNPAHSPDEPHSAGCQCAYKRLLKSADLLRANDTETASADIS